LTSPAVCSKYWRHLVCSAPCGSRAIFSSLSRRSLSGFRATLLALKSSQNPTNFVVLRQDFACFLVSPSSLSRLFEREEGVR
jgi:hypothetical protein